MDPSDFKFQTLNESAEWSKVSSWLGMVSSAAKDFSLKCIFIDKTRRKRPGEYNSLQKKFKNLEV